MMKHKPLTTQQTQVFKILRNGPSSAYEMRVSLNTLNAMWAKKWVTRVSAPGDLAFPRNAKWDITPKGNEAYLADLENINGSDT